MNQMYENRIQWQRGREHRPDKQGEVRDNTVCVRTITGAYFKGTRQGGHQANENIKTNKTDLNRHQQKCLLEHRIVSPRLHVVAPATHDRQHVVTSKNGSALAGTIHHGSCPVDREIRNYDSFVNHVGKQATGQIHERRRI